MTAFSATDAAFEGFRIAREKPKVIFVWAILSFLVSLVSAVYLISIGQEARAVFEASASEQAPDLDALLAAMGDMAPMMVVGLMVQCVMAAAVYRIVLRPADQGFAYIKLGMDEVRLAVLTFVYVLIASVLLAAVVLAAGFVAALASVGGRGPMIMVGAISEVFFLGLLLYVAVRLSLAPAITFSERRLAVFDSWKLTHGQFWRLMGAYGLAVFGIMAIAALVLILFVVLTAIALGGDLQKASLIFRPDQSSMTAYFSPVMILYLVVAAWVSALYYAVVIAPAGVAYRELSRAA